MRIKKIFLTTCFLAVSFLCFSETVSDMQVFKADHWIYDAMNTLCAECGVVPLSGNAPLSAAEIKLSLRQIDEEKLSESGKELYRKSMSLLYTKKTLLDLGAFSVFGNVKVTPEFYSRTNTNIPWSFQYNLTDNLISVPLGFGISNYFVTEIEPFLSRAWGYVHGDPKGGDYISTNLEYDFSKMEFEQPRWAYGSLGYSSDNWGVNLVMGKEGLRHGNSLMGSVVYNDEFLTDFYTQFNVFSERFRIQLDIIEVELNRYLYFHQAEFLPFKNFKFSVLEGSFVNAPFELRFLNPIMLHHSHAGWYEYETDSERNWYGNESHFCAYMCFLFEYVPIQNLRLYLNYAQTEFQTSWETPDVPGGMGMQMGAEYRLNAPALGYWIFGLEGIYTSPWMYIKNGKEWSLISFRDAPNHSGPLESWIGFKYGPDCLGGQLKIAYEKPTKWNAEFDYSLVSHGANGFRSFSKSENGYYNYFPSVKIGNEAVTEEEKENIRNQNTKMLPSGVIQYMNQIALKGEYNFDNHFSIGSSLNYSFIFNNENVDGNFQQGLEFCLSGTYRLFN